jgi:hypothetical protein
MPPAKSRTAPDDSRSEASSTREKPGNVAGLAVNGKTRRVASGLGTSSSLRDSVSVGIVSSMSTVAGGAAQDTMVGVKYRLLQPRRGETNYVDTMVHA